MRLAYGLDELPRPLDRARSPRVNRHAGRRRYREAAGKVALDLLVVEARSFSASSTDASGNGA